MGLINSFERIIIKMTNSNEFEGGVKIMAKSLVVDRVKVIAQMARLDITGEELAQKAGVGRSSVIKMRKGQAVWRTTAQHVARALGVDVSELLEPSETKKE